MLSEELKRLIRRESEILRRNQDVIERIRRERAYLETVEDVEWNLPSMRRVNTLKGQK
jgi:hypothetical protein